MALFSGSFRFSLCPLPSSTSHKSTRWKLGKRGPPSSSLFLRCSSSTDRPKRISEQSSWESKDSEGKDYLYRLGQEADNMNISVGARQGVVDDLFVGNFLGKDCASISSIYHFFSWQIDSAYFIAFVILLEH